jgi:hypothetical protein
LPAYFFLGETKSSAVEKFIHGRGELFVIRAAADDKGRYLRK